MDANGTKPRSYLKPYTDEEMLYEALAMYANNRVAFANAISADTYRTNEDEPATKEEIAFAFAAAEQAARLVAYAEEKVESPIIRLQ